MYVGIFDSTSTGKIGIAHFWRLMNKLQTYWRYKLTIAIFNE